MAARLPNLPNRKPRSVIMPGQRDSRLIAYTATEPVPQVSKDRKEYLGDYEVIRKDYSYLHLWTLSAE